MTEKKRQIERLFRLHYRTMYRLACILLHDEDESKDIVHDVFAQLLTDDAQLNELTDKALSPGMVSTDEKFNSIILRISYRKIMELCRLPKRQA